MKKICFAIAVCAFLFSCTSKRKIPDVSNINVPLKILRFDEDLFSIDTNNIAASIDKLQEKYPTFINDYLYNLMAFPPQPDSVTTGLKLFLTDSKYKMVHDTAEAKFKSFDEQLAQIKRGLQFVKYYFPDYKIPTQVITFIGPIDGYANVLTASGLAVGLQLYLGRNFSVYHSEHVEEIYADYQSARFEAPYISVNCMRNILDDMYPDKSAGSSLIEQVIEEGKRMYVLDEILPETADTLKTGYTAAQLKGCYDNEAGIWNYLLENNLLYITNQMQIRDYTTDGPTTQGLGEGSPGNIGLFVGWQIIKKWMAKYDDKKTFDELMQTPAKQIFDEAKYKPR
jgi:hypothetical protein